MLPQRLHRGFECCGGICGREANAQVMSRTLGTRAWLRAAVVGAAAAPEVDVRVAWLRGRHDGTELRHGGELRAGLPHGARAGGQVDPPAGGLRRAQQPPLDLWHREQLRRPERDGHEATDVANAAAGRLRRGLEGRDHLLPLPGPETAVSGR